MDNKSKKRIKRGQIPLFITMKSSLRQHGSKVRKAIKIVRTVFDINLHFFLSDSSIVPRIVRGIINRGCYDLYSFDEEDKTPANLPGWEPFSDSVEWANFSEPYPVPWQYVPNQELSPSWGYFDAYDGGGYVADLGFNSSTAQAVISELPNNFETFTHNSLQSARLHNDVLISRF